MWDVDTIHSFARAAQASRFHDFYHMAVLTGMRRSKLAGLKWGKVDLANGRLSVTTTLQRIDGKGLVEGQPKTLRSRRSIALSPVAVDLLHSIRGRQMEQQLIAGNAWQSLGYVFTQADGTPVYPDDITKDFALIVREARLPHLTLHGLRHASATLLLSANVAPKVVSERLGHSNIAVTMDTYSHVLPGMQEAAALALDEQLGTWPTGSGGSTNGRHSSLARKSVQNVCTIFGTGCYQIRHRREAKVRFCIWRASVGRIPSISKPVGGNPVSVRLRPSAP